ncbi:MAG: T9SS C-terminal target domain-containing protein [Flavobacteriia bacterium]|nr:T9SS C-terminal target domain-containing protein [Flavobacteriia bacterium]
MKKVYLSVLAVTAFGFSVLAQKHVAQPLTNSKHSLVESAVKKEVQSTTKGVIIWQNDFSNPAQWTASNFPNGSPAHTAGDWEITTDLNAIPRAELRPAGHTTAANGYALIDSDGAGGQATQNAQFVYNQNIDLSTEPLVLLKFEQSHRRYLETTYVVYSTNGGATWQEIEVNGTMNTNTNTTNPQTIQLNLSNEIGGQDSVRIGFKYVGQWDWFWAIDDVKLITPDAHDVAIAGVYWGSTDAWGARLPYYQIPTAQVAEIEFSGIIENLGFLNQNVTFTATAGAYNGSSNPTLISAFSSDTADCTAGFTPAAVNANISVSLGVQIDSTDVNPADNTLANAATISVNPNIYARDKNNVSGGSYNQGEGFEVGNIFDVYASDDLTAIDVHIFATAVAGASVYSKLYSIDPQTGDFVFVDESNPYTLTANDLDAVITLPLSGGAYTLNANEPYLVVVGSLGDGGATNDLIVGTSGVSEAQTSYYYDMTNTTWYYTTSTPMVRMNFSNASIAENELAASFHVSPNPAAEQVNITINESNGAAAMISVVDLTGKEVFQTTTTAGNGTQNIAINTSAFGNGMYIVNVSTNGITSSKKFIVRN